MARIDVHTHFLPEAYRDTLDDIGKRVRVVERGDNPRIIHQLDTVPLNPGFVDPAARVEWMDEHNVEKTIVSVSTPNPNEGPFTPAESTDLVKAINTGFGTLQAEHSDRIAALGSLPLRQPEIAVEELDRIASDLDLAGVAIPTSVRGRKLSHDSLEPIFDRLDELELTAFMHPRPNALSQQLEEEEWYTTPMAIFPSETTIELCRLIFDGFFDRHDFDLVVGHLGGTLPYLTGRLERGRDEFIGDGSPPEQPIPAYLEEFYYDVISFHPPAIRAAFETAGVEQFVFGTDYPFGIENATETIQSVEAALPSDADPDLVNAATARDLFDL